MNTNTARPNTDSDIKIILEADGKALQEWRFVREDLDETHRVLKVIKD